MSTKKLVSIITPCHNSEKFIEQTIESVIKQTYPNWELLLIDDCSSDSTLKILEHYSHVDERIRIFKTEKPSGSPTLPRNIGIKECKGEIILFLDSDDVITPKKLEEQVPLFDDPQTAIVFSNYEKMTEDGTRNNRVIICPQVVNYKEHLKGCSILFSNAMFDISKTGKIYFEHMGAEDYIYSLTVLKKGYIARNTNKCNSLIRKRANSVSSNKFKSAMWNWNIYYKHEKLGLFKSLYYFSFYMTKGLIKYLK